MGPLNAGIGLGSMIEADGDGFAIKQSDGSVWLAWEDLVEINRLAIAMDQVVLPVESFATALAITKKITREKREEFDRASRGRV